MISLVSAFGRKLQKEHEEEAIPFLAEKKKATASSDLQPPGVPSSKSFRDLPRYHLAQEQAFKMNTLGEINMQASDYLSEV